MSGRLTDIETVRKVVQAEINYLPNVFNERIITELFEEAQLEHHNITEDSETVKIILDGEPVADTGNPITLNDQVAVNLASQKLVWNSVVVAADLGLATVYIENVDYIIDYFNGTIERTSAGSSIPNGGAVYVWYMPYTVLTSGNDYNINYNEGWIKRRAGTSIPSKATLYVDYQHGDTTPSDTLLEELIGEMEAYIEPRLGAGLTMESDNKELKAAATNFVVYSYCLAAGVKELQVAGKDKSDSLARRWGELGERYLALSRQLFSKYLTVNTKQLGGLIENRFVKNRTLTRQLPSIAARLRRH